QALRDRPSLVAVEVDPLSVVRLDDRQCAEHAAALERADPVGECEPGGAQSRRDIGLHRDGVCADQSEALAPDTGDDYRVTGPETYPTCNDPGAIPSSPSAAPV